MTGAEQSPGVSAQPRTPQGEGGDTGTAEREAQGAAERVTAWLDQFATLRGVDQSVAHVANLVPLLTSDLRTLVAAGFRRVAEDPETVRARVDRRDELAAKIQRAVEGDPDVIRYDEDDWTRIADVVVGMLDELQRAAQREVIAQAERQVLTEAADFIERHVSQIGPASQTLAPGQSFAVKLLRDRAALRGGEQQT